MQPSKSKSATRRCIARTFQACSAVDQLRVVLDPRQAKVRHLDLKAGADKEVGRLEVPARGARLSGRLLVQGSMHRQAAPPCASEMQHAPHLWMIGGFCACRHDMPRAMSIANSTFFTTSRCRPEGRKQRQGLKMHTSR